MNRFLAAAAALLVSTPLVFAPAAAEMALYEIAFVRYDKNGDMLVTKVEFLEVLLVRFSDVDVDQDNKLEAEEVGELSSDPEFSDNDADGDGALSIEEVIDEKLTEFDDADTDKDGSLNLNEVKNYLSSQQ